MAIRSEAMLDTQAGRYTSHSLVQTCRDCYDCHVIYQFSDNPCPTCRVDEPYPSPSWQIDPSSLLRALPACAASHMGYGLTLQLLPILRIG